MRPPLGPTVRLPLAADSYLEAARGFAGLVAKMVENEVRFVEMVIFKADFLEETYFRDL